MSNPSTCFIKIDTQSEFRKRLLSGFYFCFNSIKEGFKIRCRKIIGLDGYSLEGPYTGHYLVAISKDGYTRYFQLLR